ncbi:MAG: squalene--hopene cyclase [Pirellulales bacterium]|nr:squalene--hopene cyclase [Pirellulales bacterium]
MRAFEQARRDLLEACDPSGHWTGELSSSALATATAVSALALVERHGETDARSGCFANEALEARYSELIVAGLRWLIAHQNADGGWGDTDRSRSNLATTMLVRAAFHLTGVPSKHTDALARAAEYVKRAGGVAALKKQAGRDKAFLVPILTNCALAGLLPWREVPSLPFELTCLPPWASRFAQRSVTSYAVPALVATGQARFFFEKPRNPIARAVRRAAIEKSLAQIERMQAANGSFLEGTPLTSFVVMSLAAMHRACHPVVHRGVEFLLATVRPDGSWPIEPNLSTWTTSLSLSALAAGGEDLQQHECLDWLLACQQHDVHPVTGAAAGGWGWNDRPGAVPDADDTPAALLALERWIAPGGCPDEARIGAAALQGVDWLLALQQADGGFPVFARGWSRLPADRSGADITAHTVRALAAWQHRLDLPSENQSAPAVGRLANGTTNGRYELTSRVGYAPAHSPSRTKPANVGVNGVSTAREARVRLSIQRGMAFLATNQREDGSWLPLWYGNQDEAGEANPYYGTARVLLAYRDLQRWTDKAAERGIAWLVSHQNADGGWGGSIETTGNGKPRRRSSVEETAAVVEALLAAPSTAATIAALERGLEWLTAAVEGGQHLNGSPIGHFFAKLWYYEKLYPRIFVVSALGRAVSQHETPAEPRPTMSVSSPALLEKAHARENVVRPVAR